MIAKDKLLKEIYLCKGKEWFQAKQSQTLGMNSNPYKCIIYNTY